MNAARAAYQMSGKLGSATIAPGCLVSGDDAQFFEAFGPICAAGFLIGHEDQLDDATSTRVAVDDGCDQHCDEAALHVAGPAPNQRSVRFVRSELVRREHWHDVVVAVKVHDRPIGADRADDHLMVAAVR